MKGKNCSHSSLRCCALLPSPAQPMAAEKKATSYSPVDITRPFADTMAKMKADKAAVMKKHEDAAAGAL